MKEAYKTEISKMINTCNDVELLDLIFKLLVKEDR